MSDETQDPQVPDLSKLPATGMEPSQPSEPQSPEAAPASIDAGSSVPQPEAASLNELRQALASEEEGQPKGERNIIRRITGSLRRGTGPLRKTGPLSEGKAGERPAEEAGPEAPAMEMPTDLPDDFLSSRLGGAVHDEPPTSVFDLPLTEAFGAGDASFIDKTSVFEVPSEASPEEQPTGEGGNVSGGTPVTFLNDDELAGLRAAGEAEAEGEPDWMSEIRSSAASETTETSDQAEAKKPSPRATSDPLRSFITGILHGSEARRKSDEPEISDDLLSDRLERSLGATPEGEPAAAPTSEADLPLPEDFLTFGAPPQAPTSTEEAPFSFSPEDEAFVWKDADQPTVTQPFSQTPESLGVNPEDIWGAQPAAPEQTADETPDLSKLDWQAADQKGPETPPKEIPTKLSIEDAYAEAFLTGIDYVPPEEVEAYSPDYLLKQALEGSEPAAPPISMEDVRAIALEDYQVVEGSVPPQESVESAEMVGEAAAAEDVDNLNVLAVHEPKWKTFLTARTTMEKILLVEAAIVLVAILVAVPFFVATIVRGPQHPVVSNNAPVPRPLPGNIPYPVGLTLPGGWYFPLAKSTFVNGEWKPNTSEWLEGTELRRVVALPWNPQTEAVIHTFQPGDTITVLLSNQENFTYKVASTERVAVTDTTIFTDPTPSLVIVLYQEKAQDRWVVVGKP